MSYQEDSIDWQAIRNIDEWLDANVSQQYKDQPLAQDWARVSKASEEIGEAISELILHTGQNPRKVCGDITATQAKMLIEMAQVSLTGILGIQHFTKDTWITRSILMSALKTLENRIML